MIPRNQITFFGNNDGLHTDIRLNIAIYGFKYAQRFFLLCAKKSVPHNWKYFERKLSSHEWSKGTSMCSCAKASKFSFYVSSSFDTCHQTHPNFSLVHQMYYLLNSNVVYFLCKNITDLLMLIKTFQNFVKKKQSKLQNN